MINWALLLRGIELPDGPQLLLPATC